MLHFCLSTYIATMFRTAGQFQAQFTAIFDLVRVSLDLVHHRLLFVQESVVKTIHVEDWLNHVNRLLEVFLRGTGRRLQNFLNDALLTCFVAGSYIAFKFCLCR